MGGYRPNIPFTVGAWNGDRGKLEFYSGLIDEIAVYNRTISASEVQAIFKADSAGKCSRGAAIVSLLPNHSLLAQGASSSLTVTINAAQQADTDVTLDDDLPAVVQVAGSVTVPAGTISALIPVNALASGIANITASVNGSSASTSVTVPSPPPPPLLPVP